MKRLCIVGAGIKGLTAAYLLGKRGYSVTLIEKRDRPGGWIETIEKEGFLFERGPRGIRPDEQTLSLLRMLDLEEEILPASKAAKQRFLLQKGKLRSIRSSLPLLLPALLRERSLPAKCDPDESVGEFFERRFGKKITDNLIDPLVTGIYAGDPYKLSLKAAFPTLYAWEQTHGSVVRGYFQRPKPQLKTPLFSFQKGMSRIVERLLEELEKLPVDILYNCDARRLNNSFIDARAAKTQKMASIATVNLGYNASLLRRSGFGYLVPSREQEKILGVTWDSMIFPSQGPGTRLCVMIGGVRHKIEERKLLPQALDALSRHLGITRAPDAVDVHIAKDAIPQFAPGEEGAGVGVNVSIRAAFNLASKLQKMS